jgi:hypothetical protein
MELKLKQTFVMKKYSLLMGLPVRSLILAVFWCITAALQTRPAGILRTSAGVFHPFYVSVTEFNHNQKDRTLEISCKMFADDFENALKAQSKTPVDISNPGDTAQLNKAAFEYLVKHLQLKINGRQVTIQFIGLEKENEAVWCYMQVNNVAGVSRLDVRNNLLYDMFKDQISIMHVSVKGNRKSTRLMYPDAQASFEW